MKTHRIRRRLQTLLVLLATLCLLACGSDSMVGQLWGQMGELFTIKEAIDDSLVEGETSIHIQNGKVITLGLVNTEYNELEATEREKAAENVLNILKTHIEAKEEFEKVDTVVVNFIHHEKKFLVVDVTMTVDYYVYNI
ncbi:MAG: hypothetical protein ACYSTT_25610 [Planctomycetota bacterium]